MDESINIPHGQPGHDKLYKVRPLIESLNTAFRDIYYPTCELSVEERMVGFKDCLCFKQYLPLKPTKWGIKLGYYVKLNLDTP